MESTAERTGKGRQRGINMNWHLEKKVRNNPAARKAFNELAIQVFQLSFESWYENGYWTDAYIPYTLMDGDTAAANISVNTMKTIWNGQIKNYIQLGTVMTAPSCRKQGLSRFLLEEIKKDWEGRCDGMYLFANDTVLDFYPKFGFSRQEQYQCSLPVLPQKGVIRKLSMDKPEDRRILKEHYQMSNPFSLLPMLDNYPLLMFYLRSFLKDCVYYLPKYDAVAVVEKAEEENTMICHDIFCRADVNFREILNFLSFPDTKRVILEFTPKETANCIQTPLDDDGTLFFLTKEDNPFQEQKLRFPGLSHA